MAQKKADPICGIVMPIGAMPPTYDASHWADVRKVFHTAIEAAGFVPQIVSDSFENDVIQNRIIQNLYDNEVVVCDVSGLNPNVMFELGVRLTFNKPVIAVTDDFESLPFDTKIIEHLRYPRDLHIHQTNDFTKKLSEKISLIHSKFLEKSYVTPLEALGAFEVFKPTKNEVSGERYIIDKLNELSATVRRIEQDRRRSNEAINDWSSLVDSPLSLRINLSEPVDESQMEQLIGIPSITGLSHGKGPRIKRFTVTLSDGKYATYQHALDVLRSVLSDPKLTYEFEQ